MANFASNRIEQYFMKKSLAILFRETAQHILPQVIQWRRHLHANPELSFKEFNTQNYVSGVLTQLGIEHTQGAAGTGIVAIIHGNEPQSAVVALRADMDALPIQEQNNVPYKSTIPGVMHACGHDVHTASLLGAASILQQTKTAWSGSVKLLFQPGEELLPGGASLMIRDGVLENPSPSSIFGQHVHPPLEAGKIGLRPGRYMASCDEIYMTVRGKGGHGALPQDVVDPILITSHIIVALQQIISRNTDPTIPAVLSFGKITSNGGATNVIPDEVKVLGTFRTMDEPWRMEAHRRMIKMAESIAEGMGGSCEFIIEVGYPTLFNDEVLTVQAKADAEDYLGAENVVELPIRLTAEDFSYYSQKMPACFYRLGTGNKEKGIVSPIHTSTFDIDESALEVGAGLMAWMAVCDLNRKIQHEEHSETEK